MNRHEKVLRSWGGQKSRDSRILGFPWRGNSLPQNGVSILPYGLGRSYGDSCLLDGGCQIETSGLDHLISFDGASGLLCCEAGVSLARILEFSLPRGWFVPVTPGTKFVTVGGCVANDVHGKNHHSAGSFGCFVTRLALKRSDGSVTICSPEENSGLFAATIGGLGLTGLILWVELKLRAVQSPFIRQRTETLHGLDAFFESAKKEDKNFEYSVAWLDATKTKKPRGIFIAGNHCRESEKIKKYSSAPAFKLPLTLPDFALGPRSIDLMNSAYYHLNALRTGERRVFFDPFFYPLDTVEHWNKAYGKKGLLQYQFVIPMENGLEGLQEILKKVQASRQTSFLTVVKIFGPVVSPGLLSFCRPGVTVCFDFPHLGKSTLALLDNLDRTVFSLNGALYPAKDARMSQEAFENSFPLHREFRKWIDPAFSSNFSKRTGLTP